MVSIDLLAQTVSNGILLGGIYALAALGLSLIFGIMDVVNLAHGHLLMLGGYVAIVLFTMAGLSPLVGMLAAMLVLFVIGIVLQRALLERVVDEGIEQPILVLFGVALVFQNLGQHFLGSDAQSTELTLGLGGLNLGSVLLSPSRTVTFVIAVLLVVLTWLFLEYTSTGHAIRATSQNRAAARYVGIDTDRIYMLTMGIGAALAGAAGSLLSMLFPIDPYVGWSYLLKSFAVVVLGGVGSIIGTLVGGVILGTAENVTALFLGGSYRDVMTFTIFLLVLLLKPEGLFGTGGGGE
ncbi:branched-chain amino acid transport system permease protein [Halarchaeum rubridurum]|uniref:Branched-chain amino acid ABC transporter permease n=1 Tax=Halarchaeum rubridurum TaxID=489911 RepID=A0A830FYQ6_9EURY|nr:branched-chain amino acid ABC transporter permease [Halarchaeum rubridurum]MBP1954434.1 branched-chain amino acid transport system permease protein [Halarchaeum rubridurum]GGM60977.1 branched-chain amino acid ABC transporter permease [Halarchaeum rubridurum]